MVLLVAVAGCDGGGDGQASDLCQPLPGAPEPFVLDGELVVPIDVLEVDAALTLDAARSSAAGTARMTFVSGLVGGLPAFDLRQEVVALRLDGVAVPLDALLPAAPGGSEAREIWALNRHLEPCTRHELGVDYLIANEAIDHSAPFGQRHLPGPDFTGGRIRWGLEFSDLQPGRYLERWAPSNLAHDTLSITLEVTVLGVEEPHSLVSNALEQLELAPGGWTLRWPSSSTSMSPLVELAPSAWMQVRELPEVAARVVLVDPAPPEEALEDVAIVVARALTDATARFGERPGGGTYLAVAADEGETGMEYDRGSFMVWHYARQTALHEVMHAWFGRDGFRPEAASDGWIDEACATFASRSPPSAPFQDDAPAEPQTMGDAWQRVTPEWAYFDGASIFRTLAEWYPAERVDAAMRSLTARQGRALSTKALIHTLFCAFDEDANVLALFRDHLADLDPAALDVSCGR